MRNFRDMHIWNQGMDLAVDAYKILKQFPREEEYGMKAKFGKLPFQFHQILQKDAVVPVKRNLSTTWKFL